MAQAEWRKFEFDGKEVRKRVREWERSYDKLQPLCHGKTKKKRKLRQGLLCSFFLISLTRHNKLPGREIMSQELDVTVFEILEGERTEGRCVRNKDLREKALEIAETLFLPNFKASSQWLARWKRRWNFGFRCGTSSAQRVSADFRDQLHHFRYTLLRQRIMHSLEPRNMDKTMCRQVTLFSELLSTPLPTSLTSQL